MALDKPIKRVEVFRPVEVGIKGPDKNGETRVARR